MKTLPAVWLAVSTTLTVLADNFSSRAELKAYYASKNEHHEWTKGMPLPTTLKEAGLLGDAKLVWTGSYSLIDGGTRGYLVRDSAGNYLAFCTGPGFHPIHHPQRIDVEKGSRLLIGGLRYTLQEVQLVPSGSECEQFLKTLIRETKNITDDPANAKLLTTLPLPLTKLTKE